MKLYLAPYPARQAARRELAAVLELNANALALMAMLEVEAARCAEEFHAAKHLDLETRLARRARVHRVLAALHKARGNADEAELLLARAFGRYERTHVPATLPGATAEEARAA